MNKHIFLLEHNSCKHVCTIHSLTIVTNKHVQGLFDVWHYPYSLVLYTHMDIMYAFVKFSVYCCLYKYWQINLYHAERCFYSVIVVSRALVFLYVNLDGMESFVHDVSAYTMVGNTYIGEPV